MPKKSESASARKKESVDAGITKEGKKKKDPNAPKRPLTAYFIFLNEKREDVKKTLPGSRQSIFLAYV